MGRLCYGIEKPLCDATVFVCILGEGTKTCKSNPTGIKKYFVKFSKIGEQNKKNFGIYYVSIFTWRNYGSYQTKFNKMHKICNSRCFDVLSIILWFQMN